MNISNCPMCESKMETVFMGYLCKTCGYGIPATEKAVKRHNNLCARLKQAKEDADKVKELEKVLSIFSEDYNCLKNDLLNAELNSSKLMTQNAALTAEVERLKTALYEACFNDDDCPIGEGEYPEWCKPRGDSDDGLECEATRGNIKRRECWRRMYLQSADIKISTVDALTAEVERLKKDLYEFYDAIKHSIGAIGAVGSGYLYYPSQMLMKCEKKFEQEYSELIPDCIAINATGDKGE